MRLALAFAPVLLAGLAFAAPVFAADNPTIAMSGHGEVTAAPDTAMVSSGVTTQGATARDALTANTDAMTALIAALKAAGIDDRDIQTSGFSVSPNYIYSDARDANGYTLPPKIAGYQVQNMVTVKVRALDTLGTVLDQAVTVGANTISGVSFSVADPQKLYDEARKAAFADAKARAELYAGAASAELGVVRNIAEQQNFGQPQPMMMKAAAMDMASAPVPVQGGELSFAIDVQVTWDFNQ